MAAPPVRPRGPAEVARADPQRVNTGTDCRADKFAGQAADWSTKAYADPVRYLAHRAEIVSTLGCRLEPGDRVLDLACGDGGFGAYLAGLSYSGVDASAEMVAAARSRGVDVTQGDLNDYLPPAPVQGTILFRALYYADDRVRLFRQIAGYTERKLVFDLNPRQYPLAVVTAELRTAGFTRVAVRPFLIPQTRALPVAATRTLATLERVPPAASLLLRRRFTLICAAVR